MSYWDINQFLAEDQQIEFCFLQDALEMQFVDPTKGLDEVISAEQPLHAPIWLINTIYDYLDTQNDEDQIQVKLPDFYQIKSLNRIESFRSSHRGTVDKMNFQKESPYLYEMYEALKKTTKDVVSKIDGNKIAEYLEERAKLIMGKASNAINDQKSEGMIYKYTELEREIYVQTRNKAKEYDHWKYNTRAK